MKRPMVVLWLLLTWFPRRALAKRILVALAGDPSMARAQLNSFAGKAQIMADAFYGVHH